MKTTITSLLILILTSFSLNAQCSREDSFEAIDDPAQYPVSGTASLTFELDGTKEVTFGDDFVTIQGIELRVFLSSTPRLAQGGNELEVTTEPLQDDNGGTDMGDPITGAKTFEVPSNVELGDYDYIIIQCVQADVLWGRADLAEAQGTDCAALSVEQNTIANLTIFPNPTTDFITVNGFLGTSKMSIFDTLGKELLTKEVTTNETIDVSTFKSGIYFLVVENQGENLTQKIVIQ